MSKKEEEVDESLLDEDSESEDKGSRGDSAMDAESASEDVFKDDERSTKSESESGVFPYSTQDVFEIGQCSQKGGVVPATFEPVPHHH